MKAGYLFLVIEPYVVLYNVFKVHSKALLVWSIHVHGYGMLNCFVNVAEKMNIAS